MSLFTIPLGNIWGRRRKTGLYVRNGLDQPVINQDLFNIWLGAGPL